jgi:hypothetical protein
VWCLSENLDDGSLETLMGLSLGSRFLKEYDAWKRQRNVIKQRFQRTLAQRQANLHTTLEQESEGLKVNLREIVVGEVLKAFP